MTPEKYIEACAVLRGVDFARPPEPRDVLVFTMAAVGDVYQAQRSWDEDALRVGLRKIIRAAAYWQLGYNREWLKVQEGSNAELLLANAVKLMSAKCNPSNYLAGFVALVAERDLEGCDLATLMREDVELALIGEAGVAEEGL
jgi:hypothetical protein